MATVLPTSPEDAAALERCGFKPDTAYMEVPRCERCRHWKRISHRMVVGVCTKITFAGPPTIGRPTALDAPGHLETRGDFGCTQWEATT